MIVSRRDVTHRTPVPLPPATHEDAEAAFQTYEWWGTQDFFDGFNDPVGDVFKMVLSKTEPQFSPGRDRCGVGAESLQATGH